MNAGVIAPVMAALGLVFTGAGLQASGDLIAHWSFDEYDTTVFHDVSGNGHDLFAYGDFRTYGIQPVNCREGRALLFSLHPLTGTLEVERTLDGFSMEAWIFPFAFTGDIDGQRAARTVLWVNRGAREADVHFKVTSQGALLVRGPVAWAWSGSGRLQPSVWQHVAVTYDRSAFTLYVNGRRVHGRKLDPSGPSLLLAKGMPVSIGGIYRSFSRRFDPSLKIAIDEIKFHGRVLREAEIRERYEAGASSYFVTSAPTRPAERESFSLVTYNVLHFTGKPVNGGNPPFGNGDLEEQVDYYEKVFRSLEGDVFVLQEARNRPVLEALSQRLGMEYRMSAGGIQGALLSRYAVRDFVDFPQFAMDGRTAHTRHFFRALVEIPFAGDVMIYGVHMWPYAGDNGRIEYEGITQALNDDRRLGVPQFLVGDFNRRYDSHMIRQYGLMGWRNFAFEAGIEVATAGTWSAVNPRINIDWILARGADDWRLAGCEVIRNRYTAKNDAGFVASDHLPMRVVFTFGEEAQPQDAHVEEEDKPF